MLPLLQAHEIHKSILEFLRLCFAKPHHHQSLHCWELLMGQSFSVRNCREQQTPALLVPLRRRKGGGGRQACLVCPQRLVRVGYCP